MVCFNLFIKLWLPFTPLTKDQQHLIVDCIETANNERINSDCIEYLFLISSFCHLESYYQNTIEYNKLEEIIQLKISDILRKSKLTRTYSALEYATLGSLFAFNFFKTCCENTNTLILEKNNDVLTLLEFIDDAAQFIFHQLNILGTHQGVCYSLNTNQIKHIIIKLLAVIIKENTSIFYLDNTEFTKTLKWNDYKNNTSFINNKQLFKKSLTIKHTFVVIPNYHSLFKLCLSKPLLFSTATTSYLTTKFPPFACSVIKQHRDRPQTIYSDDFCNTLLSLSQVKMNLSHDLLEKQWDLVEVDMKRSVDLIASKNDKVNYHNLIQILEDVLAIIKTTSKNVSKNTIKANFIREKAKNHIQDNKSLENNIKYELEYSQKLINLKKKWDNTIISSIYEDKERIIFQKIFSKFYQYYIFKKFIEYIKINKLDSWYFLTYADFRGRFYYDSVASPQSFWGFRHIYMCANIDFNQEAYYRSIGVLFKKEITNADGELPLSKLTTLGQDKYNALHKLSTTQLYDNLKDLTLIAEFIYYKHALTTPNETYFIWRDTTCSMAQHAVKLLGFKENTLKYVNLDNDNIAYDTYTIYIRELKKLLKRSGWSDTQLEFLTRSLLKHVIMTIGYGVTFFTAYNRHKNIAAEMFSDSETFKWITNKDVFKEIYKTLAAGQLDKLFYTDTKSNWVDNQKVDETFNLPDLKLPQFYLKPSIKLTNLELNPINGKRQHHQVSVHLDYNCDQELYIKNIKEEQLYDSEKTKRALYVNTVHALDAYYMRNLIFETRKRDHQIIAVHDGFAVPPHQGGWLISTANMIFNKPNQAFSYSNSILI